MDIIESVSLLYLMCGLSKYLEDQTLWKAQSMDELLNESEKILNEIYSYNGPDPNLLSVKPEASHHKEFFTARAKPQYSPKLNFLKSIKLESVTEKTTFVTGNCFTAQFLTLLLQLYKKFLLTSFGSGYDTGFNKFRFNNTLKTFFLLFLIGGKKAVNVYLELVDSLCLDNKPKFLDFDKIHSGKDYTCVTIYFTEDYFQEEKDKKLPSVVINRDKFLEHFNIPQLILPLTSLLNCNSPLLMECIHEHLILYQNCDKLMQKNFCGTKHLCKRLSLPSTLTNEFNAVMSSYHQKLLNYVHNRVSIFLTSEIKYNKTDKERCPLFSPDYLTNPEEFNEINYSTQVEQHFQILNNLRDNEAECEENPNLIDELQTAVEILSENWSHFKISKTAYKNLSCLMRQFLKTYRDDFLKLSKIDSEKPYQNLDIELPSITKQLYGTLLSSETLQGLVWRLKLKKYKNLNTTFAIMKYDKLYVNDETPVEKTANLLHEIVVGLALNNLKGVVNNFMYTFGGFICSPPTESDSVETMCSNTDSRNMRIIELTEYVPNIGSFADCLDKGILSKRDIIKILLQVSYALLKTQEKFNGNFLHADLHAGNVLIVKLTEEKQISFTVGTEEITFFTRYVPIIIDYGFTIMEINKVLLIPFMKDWINIGSDFEVTPDNKKQYSIISSLINFWANRYENEWNINIMLSKENFDIARLILSMESDAQNFEPYWKLIGEDCSATIITLYANLIQPEINPLIYSMFPIVQFLAEEEENGLVLNTLKNSEISRLPTVIEEEEDEETPEVSRWANFFD